MTCRAVVDQYTGWVRDPNGATCCWPCYEAGKMPPWPVDLYADVEPDIPAPSKPKAPPKRRPLSPVWD